MRSKLTALALLGAVASLPGAAPAQTQGSAPPAVRTDEGPTAGTPQPGANSFTEGQVRARMEDAGFRDVADLQKDDQGIWRGRATRNGSPTGAAGEGVVAAFPARQEESSHEWLSAPHPRHRARPARGRPADPGHPHLGGVHLAARRRAVRRGERG